MDRIKKSLQQKHFVFWEEIARDGAQAKTILSGQQRVEIAKMHSKIFGDNAPDHLVFAAGFTSIAPQEVETIKYLADNVDTCQLAVNCRSVKDEIIESISAIKRAKYPRVAFVLPASERLCQLMLHKTTKEVFEFALDFSKFVLDKANGIPADIQLAAAYDGDPILIAELADALTEMGIATIGLGDTRGKIYPLEIRRFYNTLFQHTKKNPLIAPHLHNDLGFAVQNTFEGLYQGITFASTSWLGLAERSGLARTEELTFILGYQKDKLIDRIGVDCSKLFYNNLDLKQIPIISQLISRYTHIPLKVNDIIVGTGVNSISTGTPFVDTVSFQPFDPKEVLGIEKEILVTQLASKRIITETAKRLGFFIENEEHINEILKFVKNFCYSNNTSLCPDIELVKLFEKYGDKIQNNVK